MGRYIDYDAIDYRNDKLHDKSEEFLNGVIYMAERIENAPSIRTKQIRYFDENEKIWKIGDVIVDDVPQICETCNHYDPDCETIACERCLDGKYSRYEPKAAPQQRSRR